MAANNQVVAIRISKGATVRARHIELLWWWQDDKLVYSTRQQMVDRVKASAKGTYFTYEGGVKAALYRNADSYVEWVETEPDGTIVNNLLSLERR